MQYKIIMLLLLLYLPQSYASNIYFAQVIRIDNHNVIHLLHGGELQAVSLGYISTPVNGEVFHKQANDYLKTTILDKWVRVTELTYGKNALVKPALIRTRGLILVNKEMLAKGLGVPNLATNPPNAIMTVAEKAHTENIGMWGVIEEFKRQRQDTLGGDRIKNIMDGFTASLTKVKKLGIEPYVGDLVSRKAYRFNCFMQIKKPRIFSTQYAAKNNGFELIDDVCPEE